MIAAARTCGPPSHHLNAARMMLMLLGIPYHAALLFQNEMPWEASAGTVSPVARYIVAIVHVFRMPAFFLLSGLLAAVVLTKGDATGWLKRRYVALGIPLVFALIVLNPLQIVVPQLLDGESLQHPLRGQGVGHLWFLFALLGISPLAIVAQRLLARTARFSAAALAIWSCGGVVVALAVAAVARDLVSAADYPLRNTVVAICWGIMSGLPFFLLGMLIAHRPDLAERLTLRAPAAYAALIVLVFCYARFMPLKVDTVPAVIAGGVLAIPITTGIIALCSRRLNRRSALVDTVCASSFTVYLVHHPIVVILGTLTRDLPLPWYLHYALICAITAVLSFGIWYVVRDIRGLNLLIGAVRPGKRRPVASTVVRAFPMS